MGRSRVILHPADEDPSQSRSKRKRNASNVETLEPVTTGQGLTDGKKALYHCNYCNNDISEKIRIKCVICPDFDLCVECFSVGAEVTPHKSTHPYSVMDYLSFPLICPDWNADEEMLLLEGIEMYGLSNWAEVAEHVGTKNKSQCIEHYSAVYLNSPCFPLPDLSHVMGKNREELLAMAKEQSEVKKGFSANEDLAVKDEPPLSAGVKLEDQRKEGMAARSSFTIASETSAGGGSGDTSTAAVKRASQIKDSRDGIQVEDRSIGEKKPRTSGDERPHVTELTGYNFKRQEFEIEYDNDAELLLADMEFKNADTDAERELKLRVLRIYSKRLDERKRRKDFILERNLLYPDPFEKNLSPEEKEICQHYRVFMRFHSKEEHDKLLKALIEQHRTLKKIQNLQEARAAGCHTSAQADRFIEEKKRKEAEEHARKLKDGAQAGPSGKFLQRASHLKGEPDSSPQENARGLSVSNSAVKDSSSISAGQAVSSSLDCWDITGFEGADLLSETEKELCNDIKILPSHYFSMLQSMAVGVFNGKITQKSDAHGLIRGVQPNKVDRVYDMLQAKGIRQP